MGTHGEIVIDIQEYLARAACFPGAAFAHHRSRDIFKPE